LEESVERKREKCRNSGKRKEETNKGESIVNIKMAIL